MKEKLILLNAGHGHLEEGIYVTPGKRYEDSIIKLYEGVLNKAVVSLLSLQLSYFDIKSEIVNPYNYDLSLSTRVEKANSLNQKYDCIYVSVHHNAGGGHGCEIYTSRGDTKADPIAEDLARRFLEKFPNRRLRTERVDRLTKEAHFYELARTIMPAILTEWGFMDHPLDRKYIMSYEGITQQVDCLLEWLLNWHNEGSKFFHT